MNGHLDNLDTNIAGIVVFKDGAVVHETYDNECDAATAIHVYSVTKSVISLLFDIARDKGYLESVQLVSLAWLDECMREHTRWKKIDQGYGYLWWAIDANEQACAALGDGGNSIYFNREKGFVVAIASLFKPRPKDRIDLIKTRIEPAFV